MQQAKEVLDSSQSLSECLSKALAIPREREKLVRLEQKLIDTVRDETCTRLEMQPMALYNRQMVHALAERFGFDFTTCEPPAGSDNGKGQMMGVTLVKRPTTAIPAGGLLALAPPAAAKGAAAAAAPRRARRSRGRTRRSSRCRASSS